MSSYTCTHTHIKELTPTIAHNFAHIRVRINAHNCAHIHEHAPKCNREASFTRKPPKSGNSSGEWQTQSIAWIQAKNYGPLKPLSIDISAIRWPEHAMEEPHLEESHSSNESVRVLQVRLKQVQDDQADCWMAGRSCNKQACWSPKTDLDDWPKP